MVKIAMANKIITDSEKFATGKIAEINWLPERETRSGYVLRESIEFVFEINCTKTNQVRTIQVAPNLNNRQFFYESLDKESYNLITTICLQLGLINLEQLEDDDLELELDSIINKPIKFKMKKSFNNPNLLDIDYSSLQLINFSTIKKVDKVEK
jgi:hypothetical protein